MGVKVISITDGGDGSILSDGKTIINSSVYKGPIEDTTGAGDAFLSGLLISRLKNYPIEQASKLASALASLECRELGVREGLPNSLGELQSFVSQNELEQVISTIV